MKIEEINELQEALVSLSDHETIIKTVDDSNYKLGSRLRIDKLYVDSFFALGELSRLKRVLIEHLRSDQNNLFFLMQLARLCFEKKLKLSRVFILKKSLKLAKANGNASEIARVRRNLGWAYLDIQAFATAEQQFLEVYSIDRSTRGIDYDIGCSRYYGTKIHVEAKNSIEKLFLSDSISDSGEVFQAVKKAIDTRTPFSLIRLGDGEGNLISKLEGRLKGNAFVDACFQRIVKMMFGEDFSDFDLFIEKVKPYFFSSLKNADVLGFFTGYNYLNFLQQNNIRANRPIAGRLETISFVDKYSNPQNTILTSAVATHNLHFVNDLKEKIRGLDFLGLITCHPDLGEALKVKLGIKETSTYLIKGEASSEKDRKGCESSLRPHFPDTFQHLIDEIEVPYRGALFVVGGGLLGKIYCNVIKEKGGIALDLGSILDAWAGAKSRTAFQRMDSNKFIENWII